LSTEAFSFGIELDENEKGQVVIDKLVPGGPAWKSGELHEGDELLSLQWEGKLAVDMTGASLEDVDEMLNQSSHDRMVFKFRKADGGTVIVLLRKEKIENEENIVKGFILKGEKKIGYILLPGFYTEWGNESGSGCANDVAKAIIRLKKENIDGLILDVRYNGGGSVGEALEMAGIFIDEGPLSSEKNKDGKQVTLKDPNRGTIYDGPMALMVNGQSASASELLAATLQDYNRAVIVGSNTYGKATAQRMFSLDTMSNQAAPAENKEMVKITFAKLYRLTGGTAQFNGVSPDVILPDAFDALEFREKFSKYALAPDTGKRNSYFKPLPALPVSELSVKSAARVNASDQFGEIKKFIIEGKKIYSVKTRTIPLKWDSFEKWMKENEAGENILNGEETPTKKFTVENHGGDKELFRNNPYAKEVNEVWLKNIAGDIYIEEAFFVLLDLINLQKN
jgi:carboxyl-terminal processing protease